VKREFTSERQITINRPKDEVFDYIKHLSNQKNYDTWHKMDPDAQTTTRGTDTAPLALYMRGMVYGTLF